MGGFVDAATSGTIRTRQFLKYTVWVGIVVAINVIYDHTQASHRGWFRHGNANIATRARKCENPITDIPPSYFKSQSEEDEKLLGWFRTMCGGTYLELGGLDGVLYSNSYVFNKAFGWKGVLIELRSADYEKLVINRPNELATIHAGVCNSKQVLHEVNPTYNGAVGGVWEFAAPSFREQWWKGLDLSSPNVKEVQCNSLDALLLANAPNVTMFEFMSLDVEGAEMSVLQSINFNRVAFGIMLIEADEHNPLKNLAMTEFLHSKGYSFMFDYERSYWYVNENFYEIYKHLVYEAD